jgi:hypothetical protein
MATYLVTPDAARVPAVRLVAGDLVDLGRLVAAHLARHKRLRPGLPYEAFIGDDHGAIHQSGLTRPVTFAIEQEKA